MGKDFLCYCFAVSGCCGGKGFVRLTFFFSLARGDDCWRCGAVRSKPDGVDGRDLPRNPKSKQKMEWYRRT